MRATLRIEHNGKLKTIPTALGHDDLAKLVELIGNDGALDDTPLAQWAGQIAKLVGDVPPAPEMVEPSVIGTTADGRPVHGVGNAPAPSDTQPSTESPNDIPDSG